MESEVEVDETQYKTNGGCSMLATSVRARKRKETRCGCIFSRLKTWMVVFAEIALRAKNVEKLLK